MNRLLDILARLWRLLRWPLAAAGVLFLGLVVYGCNMDLKAEKQCKEDLAAVHEMVDKAVADGMLDQSHLVVVQNSIAKMEAACADFDAPKARAIGLNIATYIAIASDGADAKRGAPEKPKADQ